MAVKDDPNTRIKAADAQALYEIAEVRDALDRLGSERGFKALVAMRLNGLLNGLTDAPAQFAAWGVDVEDESVIYHYGKGAGAKLLARDCAHGASGVILLGIHADGVAEIATYGALARDCRILGKAGAGLLEDLSACPFQTWFGWGNDGVPKRLTPEERAMLSAEQLVYVDRNTHPEAVYS